MLRTLAALLLAANLLFFVWARGWLAPVLQPPHHGEREPARLEAQVRPQSVRLLSPQAASAAATAVAMGCVEAGPFDDAQAAAAEAALAAGGVPAQAWVRASLAPAGGAWLVYMGRFADPAQLRSKQDELRRRNLPFSDVTAPPALAPGLVLSRHDSRAAAEAALALLAPRGVNSARVLQLPPAPQHWLRAARADVALQARLQAVAAQLAAQVPAQLPAAFVPCVSRP